MNRDFSRRDHSADHYYRQDPQDGVRPGRTLSLLRGLFFVSSAMAILALSFFYLSPAPGQAKEEADFPLLFRSIDRKLKESYIDLGRIDPQQLLRKAFTSMSKPSG